MLCVRLLLVGSGVVAMRLLLRFTEGLCFGLFICWWFIVFVVLASVGLAMCLYTAWFVCLLFDWFCLVWFVRLIWLGVWWRAGC